MTGSSGILSHIQSSPVSRHVTLADGSTTSISGHCIAQLDHSLSLSSVLLVPKFPFNHLSASKLTKSLNCSVTFYPSYCEIQVLKLKRKNGGGNESGGLYVFLSDWI